MDLGVWKAGLAGHVIPCVCMLWTLQRVAKLGSFEDIVTEAWGSRQLKA